MNNEKLRLILRKGVFFYEYMNFFKRLDGTQVPPKEAYSTQDLMVKGSMMKTMSNLIMCGKYST